jgi:hypothetical protein
MIFHITELDHTGESSSLPCVGWLSSLGAFTMARAAGMLPMNFLHL